MKVTKTRQRKTGFAAMALPMLLMVFLILLGLTPRGECAEKVVTYLGLVDYSGPVAGLSADIARGEVDYAKEVNSRGGVNGVKIRCISVDTRYNVARAVSAYRRYRRGNNVLVVSFHSTPFGKALRRDTVRDKIMGMFVGDGELQGKGIPGFNMVTTYQDGFAATIDWIVEDWKKKGKGGSPIIGYFSWDSAYGRESLRGGKEYAEKLGLKLLPPEYFPVGTLDHSVYLQRLAKLGSNYIIIGGVDPTQTNIMKDAHRLGLKKNIQFVSGYWGPSQTIGLRMHPDVVEDVVVASPFLRGEEAEKHPAHKLWLKHRPNEPFSNFQGVYYVGVANMKDMEAGLKIALEKVGYENLNGKVLGEAYRQLTGSRHRDGLVGTTCTYSPTNNRSSMEVKFYRVQKGKMVPISDWVKAPDAVSLHKWD